MRVLFVEDNDDVRELTLEMLLDEGLDVVACASAEAAEQAFGEREFDVVVTDVGLPGMKGTELARRLLAIRPDLWVVFLSGYPMEGAMAWGPRIRAVLKPFEGDQLKVMLDEFRLAAHGVA